MATVADAGTAVPALQSALAAENAAVYGYGVVGAMLTGDARSRADTDWRAHQVARDTLATMLVRRGVTPAAASAAYALPFTVADAAAARRLAVVLEEGVTRAYLALVGVPDAKLRSFGALAMQPAAARAVAWRGATVAFPGMPSSGLS